MAASDPTYDPAALIADTMNNLSIKLGVPIAADAVAFQSAYKGASVLLLALGITPSVDPDDDSAAAVTVREVLLEDTTRTRTRSRRAI